MDNMIEQTREELKEMLTEDAQDLVLSEAAAVGRIKRRFHAKGPSQKIHKGVTAGQKTKNAKRSAGKRHRSAIKTVRTKMKKFGRAISIKSAKLIKRAKHKRAAAGK